MKTGVCLLEGAFSGRVYSQSSQSQAHYCELFERHNITDAFDAHNFYKLTEEKRRHPSSCINYISCARRTHSLSLTRKQCISVECCMRVSAVNVCPTTVKCFVPFYLTHGCFVSEKKQKTRAATFMNDNCHAETANISKQVRCYLVRQT